MERKKRFREMILNQKNKKIKINKILSDGSQELKYK